MLQPDRSCPGSGEPLAHLSVSLLYWYNSTNTVRVLASRSHPAVSSLYWYNSTNTDTCGAL